MFANSASMLFDQLQPLHHLPVQARVQLEAGALLHDLGHRISHRGHHKHGEYLALNGDIPGLDGRDRNIVAAIVRYHNRKSEPDGHHPAYSVLNNNDKRIARRLASLVRIAEGLDHSHRQRILVSAPLSNAVPSPSRSKLAAMSPKISAMPNAAPTYSKKNSTSNSSSAAPHPPP